MALKFCSMNSLAVIASLPLQNKLMRAKMSSSKTGIVLCILIDLILQNRRRYLYISCLLMDLYLTLFSIRKQAPSYPSGTSRHLPVLWVFKDDIPSGLFIWLLLKMAGDVRIKSPIRIFNQFDKYRLNREEQVNNYHKVCHFFHPTLQTPVCPLTIWEREQEAVLYPGSLTRMLSPLQPLAKTQCPPLWTLRITTLPASRAPLIPLLATFPSYFNPRGLMDPQTKRFPLTQPPLDLSQLFKLDGLQPFPIPANAMAAELIKHPAWQMVLEEVPSCCDPQAGSHCLYIGQFLERATAKRMDRIKIFI